MAWNQPGNDNKDPWGNRNRRQDGPPELDEIFNKLKKSFKGFGGGKGGSGGGSGSIWTLLLPAFVVATLVWGFLGIYTVNELEQGVVLRFGKHDRTVGPGLGWAPPMVDRVIKVNTNQVNQTSVDGTMLTKDENIVIVKLGIQYRIENPESYLFNTVDPDGTVRQVAESAFRKVIGNSLMDDILTIGKDSISAKTELVMEEILEPYQAGVSIVALTFENASAPNEVQDAFDDAIKSREDKERTINLAEAYAREKEPLARADAERMIQEANGYTAEVLAKADGEVARFAKLLPEYELAPEVTRKRLYIETMEEVMSKSTKVMIDVEGGNNMMYLPLDKIMETNSRNRGRGGN
ncbi:MAG: FtsH protease activity modulator HflK [Pseudomonadota bacterium]